MPADQVTKVTYYFIAFFSAGNNVLEKMNYGGHSYLVILL